MTKIIMIDENKGGDEFIRVFNVDLVQLDEDRPLIGFYCKKDIEKWMNARVTSWQVMKLPRKRNVWRHIRQLFGGKKHGKNSNS